MHISQIRLIIACGELRALLELEASVESLFKIPFDNLKAATMYSCTPMR